MNASLLDGSEVLFIAQHNAQYVYRDKVCPTHIELVRPFRTLVQDLKQRAWHPWLAAIQYDIKVDLNMA